LRGIEPPAASGRERPMIAQRVEPVGEKSRALGALLSANTQVRVKLVT
jgi:hypothetical protein